MKLFCLISLIAVLASGCATSRRGNSGSPDSAGIAPASPVGAVPGSRSGMNAGAL